MNPGGGLHHTRSGEVVASGTAQRHADEGGQLYQELCRVNGRPALSGSGRKLALADDGWMSLRVVADVWKAKIPRAAAETRNLKFMHSRACREPSSPPRKVNFSIGSLWRPAGTRALRAPVLPVLLSKKNALHVTRA